MDSHNPDYVLVFTQSSRHGQIRVHILHLLNKAQKSEQPPIIGALKFLRPGNQHPEVCLPQHAARHAAHIIIIPGIAVHLPQELRHPGTAGQLPPAAEAGQKLRQLVLDDGRQLHLGTVGIQHGLIEIASLRGQPELRQLGCTEPHYRGVKHRRQRNILLHVVNHRQQRQHYLDFRGLKIAPVRAGKDGNIIGLKNLLQHISLALDGAQQHYHITPLHRPVAIIPLPQGLVKHHIAAIFQLLQPVGNMLRLQLEAL